LVSAVNYKIRKSFKSGHQAAFLLKEPFFTPYVGLPSEEGEHIMSNTNTNVIIGVLIVAVVAVAGYAMLTMPDQRSTGDRIGDAVDQLDNGLDDAARELEDRTPAERIRDDINDATDGNVN
jgi:hypothetical protein